MKILDARRLTGLNLDSGGPGVVVEVRWPDTAARDAGIARFLCDLDHFYPELAQTLPPRDRHPPVVRRWPDGCAATLVFPAAIDRLYAAVRLGEKLLEGAATTPGTAPGEVGREAWLLARHAAWKRDEEPEVTPALLAMKAWADAHDVPFLWDDDEVSLGYGASCRVWPATELPDPATLDASAFHDLPKLLITGTNGKTSTSRMLTRILRHAGFRVGATSTDALTFDEVVFEEGDWTGPGAARRILRHPGVTAAVLETARGGILRRGLGAIGADAAAVTNVGADHLGEHGIADVAGMAATKATVWQAVKPGGACVVNANCEASWAAAVTHGLLTDPRRWVLVSGRPELGAAAERLASHGRAGAIAWVLDGTAMVRRSPTGDVRVMDLATMPAGWGGLAHHNLENALVAAALASALGVADATIASGLATFGASPDDNPGRAELWRLGPHAVVLDFGHNGHGLEALAPMLQGLRARLGQPAPAPLVTSVGLAGDRERDDAVSLLDGVRAIGAEAVWVRGLVGYERGRAEGEMEDLITATFRALGVSEASLLRAASENDFLASAVARAAGTPTVIALLVHIERDEVRDWLVAHGGRPAPITSFG